MAEIFITTLEKFDSNLWGYHFPIPFDVAGKYINGSNRRVLCKVNGQLTIQSALMPSDDGWFILANKEVTKKLGLQISNKVEISIEKDNSEFGMEMPESFRVLMEQDTEGKAFFDQLTPGKQRNLIYIAGKVKNIDSQLRKGMAIMDHLKEASGKLDFKVLNQKIKEYNRLKK